MAASCLSLFVTLCLPTWLTGCALTEHKPTFPTHGVALITAIRADGNVARITLKNNDPLPEAALAAVLQRSMEIADENHFAFFEFRSVAEPGEQAPKQVPVAVWSVDPASNRATPSVMSLGIGGGTTSEIAFYREPPERASGLLLGVADVRAWRARAPEGGADSGPEPSQLLLGGNLAKIRADARWRDLTEQERQAVRLDQPGLSSDQQPPFPELGTASLIEAMLGNRPAVLSDTDIRLRIDVDEQGRTAGVTVLSTPVSAYAQALVKSLDGKRYQPGRCGQRACAMPFFVTLRLLPVDAIEARSPALNISYPAAALRAGATGVVRVLVHFGGDGGAREVVVARSSGASPEHKLLDQATVDSLRQLNWGRYLWHGQPIEGGWRAVDYVWAMN